MAKTTTNPKKMYLETFIFNWLLQHNFIINFPFENSNYTMNTWSYNCFWKQFCKIQLKLYFRGDNLINLSAGGVCAWDWDITVRFGKTKFREFSRVLIISKYCGLYGMMNIVLLFGGKKGLCNFPTVCSNRLTDGLSDGGKFNW